MRRDAPAIDEPGDVFRRATDGMRGFDIEYHTVVGVDQIIGDNNLPRRKRPRFLLSTARRENGMFPAAITVGVVGGKGPSGSIFQ